jgi:hypothetical protein
MKHFKRLHLALLALATVSLSACVPNYSDGGRAGTVAKFFHKGVFVKTWEGSMNQGGMKSVTNSEGQESLVPNTFDFHAEDDDKAVIAALEEARDTGRRVTLQYRQWFVKPFLIDSKSVVVAVKFSDGKPAASADQAASK